MAAAAVALPNNLPHLAPEINQQPITSTATQSRLQKKDVETILNFFKPNEDGSPPHPTYVGKPETYERPRNSQGVTIHDIRGDEDKYTLDSHGFQFVKHVSKEVDFLDEDKIKNEYYKEVDQLLKDTTGATSTFIFDHTIRRPSPSDPSNPNPKVPLRSPVRQVHIDQSYSAALSRVPFHLPEKSDALLKGRVQLINVWRPIKTIKRDPLCVAQSQTVDESDLVPIGLIYEKRQGETMGVKYNSKQRFYYKSEQSPGEPLLIKCFDNRAGVESEERFAGRAKRVPHSSFEIPGTEGEEARESIEVRALVFHEE